MSVIVTLRVAGDPAVFEEQVAAQGKAIGRIMEVAKRNGVVAHRWYGGAGEFVAIDEWPDAESFQTFFDEPQRRSALHGCGRRQRPTGGAVLADARHERRDRVGSVTRETALRAQPAARSGYRAAR